MSNSTLLLAQKLIARPSPTPDDNGCQEILIHYLKKLGFRIEKLHLVRWIISGRVAALPAQCYVLLGTRMSSRQDQWKAGTATHLFLPSVMAGSMGAVWQT